MKSPAPAKYAHDGACYYVVAISRISITTTAVGCFCAQLGSKGCAWKRGRTDREGFGENATEKQNAGETWNEDLKDGLGDGPPLL